MERVMAGTTEHPLDRIADQITNLRYSEMMEFGNGLVDLVKKDDETKGFSTPEAYAALLHSWAVGRHSK
jgi:hypothetical protein